MNKLLYTTKIFFCTSLLFVIQSCHQEFLEVKPTKSLVVPQTIEDFYALLDNVSTIMNKGVGLHIIAGDETFVEPSSLALYDRIDRDTYIWNLPPYPNNSSYDWSEPYKIIFYANVVLEGVKQYGDQSSQWVELAATAKFHRAWALYNLVESFGDKYDAIRLKELKGVPIRLDPDIEIIEQRASLFDTYKQIFEDLDYAKSNLSDKLEYVTRPSKVAVLALLARIYLAIEEYESALINAEMAMQLKDDLLDYNTLNVSATRPFPVGLTNANPEIIFYGTLVSASFLSLNTTLCDTLLLNNYQTNDIRRICFFKDLGHKRTNFKGSYSGSATGFGGLATDELYLVRAECLIRLNRINEAKSCLDKLLINRWVTNTYTPIHINNAEDLLRFTLMERRKQLFLRGRRWSDLKRLNKDPRFQVTLKKRGTDGQLLELPPDDDRYVFPIPGNELEYSTK